MCVFFVVLVVIAVAFGGRITTHKEFDSYILVVENVQTIRNRLVDVNRGIAAEIDLGCTQPPAITQDGQFAICAKVLPNASMEIQILDTKFSVSGVIPVRDEHSRYQQIALEQGTFAMPSTQHELSILIYGPEGDSGSLGIVSYNGNSYRIGIKDWDHMPQIILIACQDNACNSMYSGEIGNK